MSVNSVTLLGRVGKDVEVKDINGTKCATFTLATSEKYKDRNGETKELTEWHNIVSWNHAEVCEKYVSKGYQIYVEGKLRTRSWDDKDGNKRYVTEVLAKRLELLGKKENQGEQKPQQTQAPQQRPQKTQTTAMPYPTETDDSDLPF